MIRKGIRIIISLLGLTVMFITSSNIWVVWSTADKVNDRIEDMPKIDFALVLGTSRLNSAGQNNEYFEKRMDAVLDLFENEKIQKVILSGDNRSIYYNEPGDMKKALLQRGLNEDQIELDPAGLRTLDSVVRSKTIFGQNNVIIVTQKFHMHRALFIAEHEEIDAYGYVADNPNHSYLNVFIRELVARPLAVLDLFVLGTQPGSSETPDAK